MLNIKKILSLKSIYLFIIINLIIINTIKASCSVSVDPLNFGNYKPFENNDSRSDTTIYLQCNNRTRVEISLSTGNSGNYSNRALNSNGYQLFYNLYRNNGRTQIWGDGTGNTRTLRVNVNRRTRTRTIYGEIPKFQSIPPGTYTDSIIATITY